MKGYEAFAEALIQEGVEVVFGVLGGDNDSWVHELDRRGVRYVAARHEQGAVGMADGYSRVTGRIGVATVTLGPGLTNAITPMTAARLSRSQVLVILGEARPGDGYTDRFGNMIIDQEPLLRGSIGAVQRLGSAARLGGEVAQAFRHLRLGGGAIALVAPWHVLDQSEVAEGWRYTASALTLPQPQVLQPDPQRVAAVAALIAQSERPVVLGGRGAWLGGARDSLCQLADRIGAVLTTSLLGRGMFDGHPYAVGVSGGFALRDSRAILAEADCVLAFGASLNHFTMDQKRLYTTARVVHIDIDPQRLAEATVFAEQAVLGDARTTARALLEALPAEPAQRWRGPELAGRVRSIDPWRGIEFLEHPDSIDPRLVSKIADETLPSDRTVVIDIGHFMGSVGIHVGVADPSGYVLSWRLGAMGAGVPIAIGAALGRAQRPTVLFVGDGGIMTTIAELDTARRSGANLLVIIVDDGGYGAERYGCLVTNKPTHLIEFDNPDYAAVARGFGLFAETVDQPGALPGAITRALAHDGPALIDVKVDKTTWTEELFLAMTSFRGRDG